MDAKVKACYDAIVASVAGGSPAIFWIRSEAVVRGHVRWHFFTCRGLKPTRKAFCLRKKEFIGRFIPRL